MPSKIEAIKKQFPLAPYVAKYTNGLKATGPHFLIGRCPFHQPSTDPANKRKFWVNTQHNICGCFHPACRAYCNQGEDPSSKPLDIINFYALINGLSNEQAIAQLSQEGQALR